MVQAHPLAFRSAQTTPIVSMELALVFTCQTLLARIAGVINFPITWTPIVKARPE